MGSSLRTSRRVSKRVGFVFEEGRLCGGLSFVLFLRVAVGGQTLFGTRREPAPSLCLSHQRNEAVATARKSTAMSDISGAPKGGCPSPWTSDYVLFVFPGRCDGLILRTTERNRGAASPGQGHGPERRTEQQSV